MSVVAIRAALETALNSMSPGLSTAWENVTFTPVAGTPYQRVDFLRAEPDNSEIGPNYLEVGYMQVGLCYPIGSGPAAAEARAQLLRTTFKRGNSFSSGGVTVTVTRTPEVAGGQNDGDRYFVAVRIRFIASITA